MGVDIDLYEFKETIKKYENEDFFDDFQCRTAKLIKVGETTKKIDKRLFELGYKKGETAMIILQE